MNQPKLFEQSTASVLLEDVLLYALGDFQSRGKILANRELALDRLHGAFLRSFSKFGIAQLSDEAIIAGLRDLSVTVTEVQNFVAKRPYRVSVNDEICRKAVKHFTKIQSAGRFQKL